MNKKNNSCEMFKLLQVKAEKENEQNKLKLLYCDIIKENILECQHCGDLYRCIFVYYKD